MLLSSHVVKTFYVMRHFENINHYANVDPRSLLNRKERGTMKLFMKTAKKALICSTVLGCSTSLWAENQCSLEFNPPEYRLVNGVNTLTIEAKGTEKNTVAFPYSDAGEYFSEGRIPVKVGGAWGFADATGKMIIPVRYESANDFSDGLSQVGQRGRILFIGPSGNTILDIPPNRFSWVGQFSEGLSPIMTSATGTGRLQKGFIDKRGLIIIKPAFDQVLPFDGGMAPAMEKGKWGAIDKTGRWVIRPQFEDPFFFNDGIAVAKLGNKFGLIDRRGQFILQPQFQSALHVSEGMASVSIEGRWGFIDRAGKIVIPPKFDEAQPFSEQLAAVRVGELYGFIDSSSALVIAPQFQRTGRFQSGLSPVAINGKWGFINRKGEMVIAPVFDDASNFSEGVARVSINRLYGFIQKPKCTE